MGKNRQMSGGGQPTPRITSEQREQSQKIIDERWGNILSKEEREELLNSLIDANLYVSGYESGAYSIEIQSFEFKNKLLKHFLEKDWDYNTRFTKEQKQEFIDNHNFDYHESYREECRNYDEGNINVFDNHDDAFKYILCLLDDCDMYFYRKTHPRNELENVDESKYLCLTRNSTR